MSKDIGCIRHKTENEKSQLIMYFGTNGCAGHHPKGISRGLNPQEAALWRFIDNISWFESINSNPGYRMVKIFGELFSAYSVPWSVDDHRGGSHTNVFWEGEHTREEMEAYIKQDAFLRRQFRFKLEANMVRKGDIVHAADDSLVQINHIGPNGEVHYKAYADAARGQLQYGPYTYFYGYITDCYPATEKQKQWLRKWISKHGGVV